MFLHHLGAMVGEADTDKLASLPMDVLMDWQAYISARNDDGDKGQMNPSSALEFFRTAYGQK